MFLGPNKMKMSHYFSVFYTLWNLGLFDFRTSLPYLDKQKVILLPKVCVYNWIILSDMRKVILLRFLLLSICHQIQFLSSQQMKVLKEHP